jgi:hypothetical protein
LALRSFASVIIDAEIEPISSAKRGSPDAESLVSLLSWRFGLKLGGYGCGPIGYGGAVERRPLRKIAVAAVDLM